MRKPIVVVGSINTDLVALTPKIPVVGETVLGTDFKIHPGGKGANQAVAVARLGYPVRMIGRLGDDPFGVQLKGHLESAGVEVSGVGTSEGSSGVAVILVSQEGENSIVVAPGANAKLTPQDLEANLEIIREAGIVLAQLEIPLETVEYLAKICSRVGVPLILDPAPAQELPRGIYRHIAWFTPNQTEAAFFTGNGRMRGKDLDPSEVAQMILRMGTHGVLLKRGSKGAYLATSNALREDIRPYPAKAIDSTAAGDAFNGGFATGLMLGKSPVESACFAAAAAAISVTRAGAQPSMPTMSDVERLLESEGVRTPISEWITKRDFERDAGG
jgi:ribokinase